MAMTPMTQNDPGRKGNLRTALVLASIAAAFFVGIIVRRWLFGA